MANTSGADSQYGLGGFSPVLQANRHGIQEGISSDNELSYGHDLFTEMRTLLTVQRGLSFAAEYASNADVPRRYGVEDCAPSGDRRRRDQRRPPGRGRNDRGRQEGGSGADRARRGHHELCGPDGAAVVNYGVPRPSTRYSSTAG